MRQRRYKVWDQDQAIDLTPLIDVVFVVLIMFIVVAPMLDVDKIDLATGKRDSLNSVQNFKEDQALNIHVKADDSIWINKQSLSLEGLAIFLREAKMTQPTTVPKLFHDRMGSFGRFQEIKTVVENCGFEELDVILRPS